MRTFQFALVALIISSGLIYAQETTDDLSLKNGIVYIEKSSPSFTNKKDLCSYYTGLLLVETNQKITREFSGKGGKWFSNTRYSWIGPSNYTNKCNAGQPDTLAGVFTLIISSSKPFNVKDKLKNDISVNSFKVNYKIILKDNSYDIKYRGIVLMGSKMNTMKGSVQTIEKPIEEIYQAYIEEGKKNKDLKQLFKDLNSICELFNNTLSQQVDYKIKTSELD